MITQTQLIISQLESGNLETIGRAIRDIIAAHAVERAKAQRMWDYYEGRHDILNRTVDDPTKPNNRLVNDFPGEIVDTAVGYFIGNPIAYASDDADLLNEVNAIRLRNNEELHNERLVREMCVTGCAYELLYIDEDAQVRWMRIPATEMAVVYDGSRTDVIAYALRYYPVLIDGRQVTKCELYDSKQVTYYLLDGGALLLDDSEPVNPRPHPFGDVPVVVYPNGDSRQGDFEKVVTLVDDYDLRVSDDSNELAYFRNAYLYLKGMMGTNPEDIAAARQSGAFLLPEDGEAGFLVKQINDAFVQHHYERLERNIHRFSKTPDLADEAFAGNLSGVAIKYKLFELETKCISKERCMSASLRRRWQLVNAVLTVKGNAFDISQLRWEFKRNVPVNKAEEAALAVQLKGIVSDETIISQLSFIDDPKAELERLKAEREASLADYGFSQRTDTGGLSAGQAAGE